MAMAEPKYGSYEYVVMMNEYEFLKKWEARFSQNEHLSPDERTAFNQDVQALWENGYVFHHEEHCTEHPGDADHGENE